MIFDNMAVCCSIEQTICPINSKVKPKIMNAIYPLLWSDRMPVVLSLYMQYWIFYFAM